MKKLTLSQIFVSISPNFPYDPYRIFPALYKHFNHLSLTEFSQLTLDSILEYPAFSFYVKNRIEVQKQFKYCDLNTWAHHNHIFVYKASLRRPDLVDKFYNPLDSQSNLELIELAFHMYFELECHSHINNILNSIRLFIKNYQKNPCTS